MSLSSRFGAIISHMVIDMDGECQTISQIQAFLAGTLEVRFCVPATDDERYAHIVGVAQRFGYARLNRPDKGVVLRYLQRTSGYSRSQITRLLARELIQTPLDKLASLQGVVNFLRTGTTIEQLQSKAKTQTDLDAAKALNVARLKLFDLFNRRPKSAA